MLRAQAEPLFFEGGDFLGEGPYWAADRAKLLWVDIMESELHSVGADGRGHRVIETSEKVHAIAMASYPWAICTVHRHGLAWLNLADGTLVPLLNPEPDAPHNLLNDARCDRKGRFWFGSLHKKHEPTGSLYSLDRDGLLRRHETGFGASNGIAFSPDDRALYFADTYSGLFKFDFDLDSGTVSNRRKIFDATAGHGLPDGLTIDTSGCLWVAMALSGQVARLTPEGRIDRTVEVPAAFVTSCTFGGFSLDTLMITTARAGRPAEELARQPHAGAVFAVDVGEKGFAETNYAGTPPLSPIASR